MQLPLTCALTVACSLGAKGVTLGFRLGICNLDCKGEMTHMVASIAMSPEC